jgi:hypothetical protein
MPKTMRAAVVHEFCKPLVIEEVAVPEPGAGQIQVKIEASGGHTDLHAAWIAKSQNILAHRRLAVPHQLTRSEGPGRPITPSHHR